LMFCQMKRQGVLGFNLGFRLIEILKRTNSHYSLIIRYFTILGIREYVQLFKSWTYTFMANSVPICCIC
jgi:hypothetical protein